ncbi:MAG: hypothetical protein AB1483_12480 [Candidatus Zixiibacteriota bacterium]
MSSKYWYLCLTGLLVIAVICGCSGNEENPIIIIDEDTEGVIGPEGGTIQLAGLVSLTIPPEALSDTIRFTITPCASPPLIADDILFVSTCYSIEPSGTIFNSPAVLTMSYGDSYFAGDIEEDSVRLFTHDGTSWSILPTSISTTYNQVAAAITHLSDFVVAADTSTFEPPPAEGVFAEILLGRSIYLEEGEIEPERNDVIMARFDSAYAPDSPIIPLRADSVLCGEYCLSWNEAGYYAYGSPGDMDFLELGEKYPLLVFGSESVPALSDSIAFPMKEQYVIDPTNEDTVSIDGFEISWTNPGSGYVRLVIVGGESDSLVIVEGINNNGNYTFSAEELSGLNPGDYELVLIRENTKMIAAEGYDPRSEIVARITNVTMLHIE